MAVDYTQYLNPRAKAASWNDRYAGMQNPYGRTLSLPTSTVTDMIRTLGGYQSENNMTEVEKQRYAGFSDPSKVGPTHCFNRVEYNPNTHLARYVFNTGRQYYKQLGPIQAQRWATSPSLGTYYNAFIRMKLNNTPLGRLFYSRR